MCSLGLAAGDAPQNDQVKVLAHISGEREQGDLQQAPSRSPLQGTLGRTATMLQHLGGLTALPYSPAVAPHTDPPSPLLGTVGSSAGGRPCVFPGCGAALVLVLVLVVMSVLDHFSPPLSFSLMGGSAVTRRGPPRSS